MNADVPQVEVNDTLNVIVLVSSIANTMTTTIHSVSLPATSTATIASAARVGPTAILLNSMQNMRLDTDGIQGLATSYRMTERLQSFRINIPGFQLSEAAHCTSNIKQPPQVNINKHSRKLETPPTTFSTNAQEFADFSDWERQDARRRLCALRLLLQYTSRHARL